MINNFLVFIFGLTFLYCFDDQIKVVERMSAILIEPGYYLSENDSSFEFKNHRYLVKTKEFFDQNGLITRVAIRKSEGYLEFSKVEFSKLKDFLYDHGFSKSLKANIIDEHSIKLNTKSFDVQYIDRQEKKIFYTLGSKKNVLYCLIYK